MSRVAFFAPLKSPNHAIPSGDREMAAGIMAALSMNSLSLTVDLVSELRCYDGRGDATKQKAIRVQAAGEIERLLADDRHRRWQAWVTYHNYYKAPDLVGPTICEQLDIPYILIEASIAKDRMNGPWAEFSATADSACARASIILYVTERDRPALERHQQPGQTVARLRPFLNLSVLPDVMRSTTVGNRLLATGMHRHGDKFASYQIIADMLSHLDTGSWHLSVAGDGPARAQVESLFANFGDQVVFLGQLDKPALAQAMDQANVFVWPGVNEAFGMVYLEAQAAGLPVVAQDRPGIRDVIANSRSLVSMNSPELLAQAVDNILASPSLQSTLGQEGRAFIASRHLLGNAASTLSGHLASVIQS